MKENEFRNAILKVFDTSGYEKIYSIAQNSGGWEGWLQCELGVLFEQNNIQYNREVQVWESSAEECDFLFQDGFIAELKCLGWKRIQKRKITINFNFSSIQSKWEEFEKEVIKDWIKVSNYKGRGIAVAIIPVFTDSDRGFRQKLWGDYHAININNIFHMYYKYK